MYALIHVSFNFVMSRLYITERFNFLRKLYRYKWYKWRICFYFIFVERQSMIYKECSYSLTDHQTLCVCAYYAQGKVSKMNESETGMEIVRCDLDITAINAISFPAFSPPGLDVKVHVSMNKHWTFSVTPLDITCVFFVTVSFYWCKFFDR